MLAEGRSRYTLVRGVVMCERAYLRAVRLCVGVGVDGNVDADVDATCAGRRDLSR